MRALLLCVPLLVSLGACKKQESAAPAAGSDTAKPMPAAEVQRGKDACNSYVTKVCSCTSDAAKSVCGLAKALPDAVETALQIATSPETHKRDALQAQDMIRKTTKECIELAAKLPALGCN